MSSETVRESAAEVAALIPRYQWELMDEGQRDDLIEQIVLPRYMKTTSDGVQMGPKWWGDLVGASQPAVKNRIQRLQKGEKPGDDAGSTSAMTENDQARLRGAKSILRRHPEAASKLVEGLPEAQRLALAQEATKPETGEPPKPRAPRHDADGDPNRWERDRIKVLLGQADHHLRVAVTDASKHEWSDDDSGALVERIARTKELVGLLELACTNRSDIDWDGELARLVGEGAA